MKQKISNILFIIGIIAVIIMLFSFDISFTELLQNIREAGYWLPADLALWFFLYVLNAVAWYSIIITNGRKDVSFSYILRLTISGFAPQ